MRAVVAGSSPAGFQADDEREARYLTEYNGIAAMRREALCERGYTPAAIDTVDVEYRGLIADGYYGFQSDKSWYETDESSVEDPRTELAALRASVPDNRDGDEMSSLDPEIERQPEDLGYA